MAYDYARLNHSKQLYDPFVHGMTYSRPFTTTPDAMLIIGHILRDAWCAKGSTGLPHTMTVGSTA